MYSARCKVDRKNMILFSNVEELREIRKEYVEIEEGKDGEDHKPLYDLNPNELPVAWSKYKCGVDLCEELERFGMPENASMMIQDFLKEKCCDWMHVVNSLLEVELNQDNEDHEDPLNVAEFWEKLLEELKVLHLKISRITKLIILNKTFGKSA